MKRLPIFTILTLLLLSACEESRTALVTPVTESDHITGVWKMVSFDGEEPPEDLENKGVYFTFYGDGRLVLEIRQKMPHRRGGDRKIEAYYRIIAGGQLALRHPGDTESTSLSLTRVPSDGRLLLSREGLTLALERIGAVQE